MNWGELTGRRGSFAVRTVRGEGRKNKMNEVSALKTIERKAFQKWVWKRAYWKATAEADMWAVKRRGYE